MANEKFWQRGTSQAKWVPTIAAIAAPTAAEITAGTEITEAIAEISGWGYTNQPIDTPDWKNTFTSQIPGPNTADDSSFVLYDYKDNQTIKTLLAKAAVGYIVLSPYSGFAAAAKVDVFPVTIGGNNRIYTADTEAARYRATFTITSSPALTVAVAA